MGGAGGPQLRASTSKVGALAALVGRSVGRMANRLKDATSPYLLQHADNPVDWWEWGPEAFAEAKRRNVPVLLSVGYAACHWCHVVGVARTPAPLRPFRA